MSNYSYVAVDARGAESRGTLDVADQIEAIRRIKEMGLFPTRILQAREPHSFGHKAHAHPEPGHRSWARPVVLLPQRVKPMTLAIFTRQLATLLEAGLPLLRGLRILEEQEENRTLQRAIGDMAVAIETGESLGDAVGSRPKLFSKLYANMVKAGELGGALDLTLKRLAEFLEKAERIKGRIKAAMFYPCAVLVVAVSILMLMMGFIVPRFRAVFEGLFNGAPLPAFTVFVFDISRAIQHRLVAIFLSTGVAVLVFVFFKSTSAGRLALDRFKLSLPVLGSIFRKAAISKFARTLGTLLGNGVPILQALIIVRETAGNMAYGRVIQRVHARVKEGDPIAPTLKNSGLFPSMVGGMVDVGEQTGALPDMLIRVADTYDEQVDNASAGLTSLIEPIMIVFLAVVVGSIVIAMFLPIINAPGLFDRETGRAD